MSIALRRHGGDFGDYVEHRHTTTHELPRHLVKVRDGNDETVHYFHTEEELAEFGADNPDLKLFGGEEEATRPRSIEKSKNGSTRGGRGTWNCTRARPSWNCWPKLDKKGLNVEHYSGAGPAAV